MPYSRSQARLDAANRLQGLKAPYHFARIRTRALPTPVRDAVFQTCVFQMSAIFEDYIQSVTRSWFDKVQSVGLPNSALPEYTRTVAILKYQEQAFKRFVGLGDEGSFVDSVLIDKDVYNLMSSSEHVPPCDFHNLLIKDKKFPTVRNFEKLFRRLGVERVLGKMSAKTSSTFDLNLQSFMDIRNALAHESPPSITHVDVKRYLEQTSAWISGLDRILYSHVVKTSGPNAW